MTGTSQTSGVVPAILSHVRYIYFICTGLLNSRRDVNGVGKALMCFELDSRIKGQVQSEIMHVECKNIGRQTQVVSKSLEEPSLYARNKLKK